jgi:UV DNA damage endonuclease
LLFFRITSELVPFASHPVCQFDWSSHFQDRFASIGAFIMANGIRISMHPGQYTLLNSPDSGVFENSIRELQYHAGVLDTLGLDTSAKIQIHVGGVYGDKEDSIRRFIKRYRGLEEVIKRRLVIENDDRSYTVDDCIRIHKETGVPVLFDDFHHELNNSGISRTAALAYVAGTWQNPDGIPMVDYSHHHAGGRKVSHIESIDASHFEDFLTSTRSFDFDIMLEIKDKELSAIKAVEIARKDKRFSND